MSKTYNFFVYCKKSKQLIAIMLLIIGSIDLGVAQSKDKKSIAEDYYHAAITACDIEKDYDKAYQLMAKAKKLDKQNTTYAYELAYICFLSKRYNKGVKVLEKAIAKYDIQQKEFYYLQADLYLLLSQSDKAESVLQQAIVKFPQEGKMYNLLGGIAYKSGNNDKAVDYWERGIENAPNYADNYYWASILYCNSTEPIWGIIYGELFINLQPNSDKCQEVSDLLYQTFNKHAYYNTARKTQQAMFSQWANDFVMLAMLDWDKEVLPFRVLINKCFSVPMVKKVDDKLETFNIMRSYFVEQWYSMNYNTYYQNILFDFQKKLKNNNYLTAYNYWLLRSGNPALFDEWYKNNQKYFKQFILWFNENPLELNNSNRFYRRQYGKAME